MIHDKVSTPSLRFAPSPTGGLHIGTARTALFNWLAARSMKARLILRIEDTDIKRSVKSYEKAIIEDLKWLGLDWDEFYRQSERLTNYKKYAEQLLKDGKAYPCFCSRERLEQLKSKKYEEGRISKYDNHCRSLSENEISSNINEGKEYALRFKVPDCEIRFNDIIRGEIKFSSKVIEDFVILKSDGTPTYNFAVVVDDCDMSITHVLRGEDHITNTAKQIMLFKSLGFDIPKFGNLSMILGKDGAKLSKRHRSQTITEFRQEGYINDAVGNYLALLSWAPKDGKEIFNIKDILKIFKIPDISKSPAIFDIDKLNWINGIHIRQKSDESLYKLVLPFVLAKKILLETEAKDRIKKEKLLRCVDAFKNNLKILAEFPEYIEDYFVKNIENFSVEAMQMLKIDSSRIVLNTMLEKLSYLESIKSFDDIIGFNLHYCKNLITEIGEILKKENINGKLLYMPIRSALTGQTHGPELPKVMAILGAKNCILRLRKALELIKLQKGGIWV